MSLAFPDVHATRNQAPACHPDLATAAYEDAELLLSSILPDARIEQLGASASAGIAIGVAVARDTFDESMSVLLEAGYLRRSHDDADDRQAMLTAPDGDIAVTLHLVESGERRESLTQLITA